MSLKNEERIKSDNLREKIINRDNKKCVICGSKADLEVHHKLAIYRGGNSEQENLITLCSTCHKRAPETGEAEFKEYKNDPLLFVFKKMLNKDDLQQQILFGFLDFINSKLELYLEKQLITNEQKSQILFFEIEELKKISLNKEDGHL